MIEILVIWQLTKSLGKKLEEKGFNSPWYKTIIGSLWLAGEMVGIYLGVIIWGTGNYIQLSGKLFGITQRTANNLPSIYLLGLLGALIGASIARWWIVEQPGLLDRWWRLIASASGIFFFLTIFLVPEKRMDYYNNDIFIFFAMFSFLGIMLWTIVHQYLLIESLWQGGLGALSILIWVILIIGVLFGGRDFVDTDTFVPILWSALLISAVVFIWAILDSITGKNLFKLRVNSKQEKRDTKSLTSEKITSEEAERKKVEKYGVEVVICPSCNTINSLSFAECRKCSKSLAKAKSVRNPYL